MWGKFKTFFLSDLDIAAMDRPKWGTPDDGNSCVNTFIKSVPTK